MKKGIIVDRVWKKYHMGEVHDSLRDLIPALTRRIAGRGPRIDELTEGDFWALKDISFTVEPGKALGIIGANGAGKSTVLKLLNRIIRPNRGSIEIYGRVGALIEIAAGFHQDLTGRENVYLQGAIMGMKQAEITNKFDEIVAFSGIEDFIDTPVKRYSSGMNARLGFSIAAHLDPEVLLIDEVLAVGDYRFQQKAFERLSDIVRRGIPVVIVSHQLDRVATLCDEAILLYKGRIMEQGTPGDCISAYFRKSNNGAAHPANNKIQIGKVNVEPDNEIQSGSVVSFTIPVVLKEKINAAEYSISLDIKDTKTATSLYLTTNYAADVPFPEADNFSLLFSIEMNVSPGTYFAEIVVRDIERRERIYESEPIFLHVIEGLPFVGYIQMNRKIQVLR